MLLLRLEVGGFFGKFYNKTADTAASTPATFVRESASFRSSSVDAGAIDANANSFAVSPVDSRSLWDCGCSFRRKYELATLALISATFACNAFSPFSVMYSRPLFEVLGA